MAGRRFHLTAPVVREPELHRQIADVLRLELALPGHISKDGVVWWSVDMAAYAGRVPGLRTARGCVAGVPDIIVLFEGKAYFIELKAKDGSLSPAQMSMAVVIVLCGASFAVARSADEVLGLLDTWRVPRARRIV